MVRQRLLRVSAEISIHFSHQLAVGIGLSGSVHLSNQLEVVLRSDAFSPERWQRRHAIGDFKDRVVEIPDRVRRSGARPLTTIVNCCPSERGIPEVGDRFELNVRELGVMEVVNGGYIGLVNVRQTYC